MENKEEIVMKLKILLKSIRAGSGIADLILHQNQEAITILFRNGAAREVNIAADSGYAIIMDVLKAL